MINLSLLSDEDWAEVQRQYRDESIRRWNAQAEKSWKGHIRPEFIEMLNEEFKKELLKELS